MDNKNSIRARVSADPRTLMMRAARADHTLPYFRSASSSVGPVVSIEGQDRIMLGSANYLGLGQHPGVIDAARRAIDKYGATITGSRLLNGTTDLHLELEAEIAQWQRSEAAMVFTTGYQANVGTISALLGPNDTVIADSGDHASLLDGCTLSRAKIRPFRHNDVAALDDQLTKASGDGGAVLVVVDSVFSMEGDVSPLDRIVATCQRHGATLMVDEAHGVGTIGRNGAGACHLYGVNTNVDVFMGSLSKALGATGGFIAGDTDVIDYLRVNSRAFLFTTAAVPAALGAALAAVKLCQTQEGAELAVSTRRNAAQLRKGLEDLGLVVPPLSTTPDGTPIITPVIAVVVGPDDVAVEWWKQLYDRNVFTSVALFPAVPAKRALLRLSPIATHTSAHIDQALDAFAQAQTAMAPTT